MSQPRRTAAEPHLSKSRFLSGLQCHKRLHLETYAPGLASDPDEQVRARLEMGIEVGELARGCFPGGVVVDADRLEARDTLSRTAELVSDPGVPAIFEGMFEYDNTVVRVDILRRVARKTWRLIEVKSSARVRDDHLDDVAIQAYVLNGAGIRLDGSALMHLNTEHLYPGGPLDLNQLFCSQDVTAEVGARQAGIPGRVAKMREVLTAFRPPAIEPDHHCHEPHGCPFWVHCTEGKPARWIYHLPGGKRTFQADGTMRHEEYLCSDPKDPRKEFALSLLQSIGREGSICVYSGYEARILRRALLDYCGRDGLAMVELRKALKAKVTSAAP